MKGRRQIEEWRRRNGWREHFSTEDYFKILDNVFHEIDDDEYEEEEEE